MCWNADLPSSLNIAKGWNKTSRRCACQGELKIVNQVYLTNPPKYLYKCVKCGREEIVHYSSINNLLNKLNENPESIRITVTG